ncbi:MAG: hypothetical protein J6C98_09680 [Oscillospiraceae bacterium]|nr:hypothetical protein [Oscillospiraceae bacterium]
MVGYDFYIDAYKGGSIAVEEWPLFEARAAEQLARYRRIYTVTAPEENAEAMAVCAMADAFAWFAAAQNGAAGTVSSASIGSVSVSYAGAQNAVDLSPRGQARELLRCAGQYLDIYRGVG